MGTKTLRHRRNVRRKIRNRFNNSVDVTFNLPLCMLLFILKVLLISNVLHCVVDTAVFHLRSFLFIVLFFFCIYVGSLQNYH